MGVIVAADGGNTKTDLVVASLEGEPLAYVRGPGSNSHGPREAEGTVDVLASLVERAGLAGPLPEPAVEDDPLLEAREYQKYLLERAVQVMEPEFEPTTWQACMECAVHGRPAAEVAARLGISVASVYAARSRVLRRLRERVADLLDDAGE